MSRFKRCISLLLVLGILLGVLAPATQAASVERTAALDTGDMTIEGTNGFGTLLSQELTENQTETEGESSEYPDGYSVTDLEIVANAATVTYDSMEEATLVVALYTEDGLQLITSGMTTVAPDATEATVTFGDEMPEYFMASAYLLDSYDLSPLCAAYDTPMYTREMQELLDSTVDDYDPDRVLNLDDDETTNFAVYADSTIVIETVEDRNTIASIDEENATYIIKNADEQITSLVEGDVFVYPYAENEILIVKIADIVVHGTTVTITGAELSMEEVFSAVKIEGDDSTENMIVDEDSVEDGVIYEGISDPENVDLLLPMGDEIGGEISNTVRFQVDKDIVSTANRKVNIAGSIEFSINVALSYYISASHQHVEFRVDYSIAAAFTITGTIGHEWRLCKAAFYPIPCLDIAIEPTFKIEVSGSIEFSAALSGAVGFITDGKSGFQPIRSAPQFDPSVEAECTIFIGFDLKPQIEIAEGFLAELVVELPIGLEFEITQTGNNGKTPSQSEPTYHTCTKCLDIESFFKIGTKFTAQFLKCKWLKVEYAPRDYRVTLGHRYLSFDHAQWGWGLCPYMTHRLTVVVLDENEVPVDNADVKVAGEAKKTSGKGIAVFYLKAGNYPLEISSEGLSRKHSIKINRAMKAMVKLTTDPDAANDNFGFISTDDFIDDTPLVIETGKCGDSVHWELNNRGRLLISGWGPMWNYNYGDTPWYSERNSITEVIVESHFEDSVNTIGNCAFADCENLRSVSIGDNVTTIGTGAFLGCTSLTSVEIPDGVTTIGDQTFQDCTSLTSVKIPNSVTTIGYSAFIRCTSLTSVKIPDSVTTIGAQAFSQCEGLTSIVIGDSVTTIRNFAFSDCTSLTSVTIPDRVTSIGSAAFSGCDRLRYITFRGDAPAIGHIAFSAVTATAYYPVGNATWTSDVMQNYGGTITWVAYTLGRNGGQSLNEAAAIAPAPGKISAESTPVDVAPKNRGEDPISPQAVFGGEYSGLVTDTYILKTASFSGLVPGEQYVLLAMVSIDVENPLAADNLLYIDQAAALEDGTLVFRYVQRTPTETSYVVACGASNKDLKDAEITFPEMVADGEIQVVNPTVVYDGKTLVEGQDYTISGTVSVTEPGTYTCYIRGIRNYSGLVECTYAVISPYKEVAFGFCGDNMTWTFYDNGRLTISGNGPMTEFSSFGVVPWNDRRSSIITVILEDGVTTIGDFAFAECTNLTSVTMADSITTIGDLAFSECTGLTSVEVPDSVTTIGSLAFNDCAGLTDIAIGDSVTIIGSQSFQYCSSLTSVEIPDSVTVIPYGAFQSCGNLTSITIPGSVTTIGNAAFKSCTSLTSVEIPVSVTTIGNDTFRSCSGLTGIYVDENNPIYSSDERGVLFDKAKTELIQAPGAISGSYEIPDSVTIICPYAFNYCTGLTSVKIPNGVTTIGSDAFRSCTNLSHITFMGDAPNIDEEAFYRVTATACYPGNAPTWTKNVLQNYGGNITWMPYTVVTEVANGWSGDITWKLYDDGRLVFTGPGKMRNYHNKSEMPWYSYMDQIESVIIEDGVTSIGDFAFYGFSITSIDIPESVTYIGAFAFKNAAALDHVVLPSGLTKMGESAFYACTSLSSIEIPNKLWTIQPYTFKNCTALSSVTFHEGNLEKISDGAFYNTALTHVELPDCLDILDSYVFKNCTQLADIKLSASLTQIREASLYGTAIASIEIPEGVTSIKPYAFKNCVNLETVELPSTLTSVGEAAFYACTQLTTLELPDAVTSIGDYAFRKCIGLASVKFGSGLATIGECSFYGCESITNLVLRRGVTTIKAYAFKGCTALKGLSLPSTLTTLGDSAFHSCVSLSEVTIPAKVTTIGAYCFSGSTGIKMIDFWGNAPTIAAGAFNKITATAWYPQGNATWTSAKLQNYGGSITWKAS